MLAGRGALSLDDPVRKHIPELQEIAGPITIGHLIDHSGGLRNEFGLLSVAGYRMDDVFTKEAILGLLFRQDALNFAPGAEYLYCNSG